MKLENKTILITGGTSGIGFQLAKQLYSRENTIIVLGRAGKRLQECKNEGFETISCDLKDVSQIEQAAIQIQQLYPNLNVLFNNAGVQEQFDFTDGLDHRERIFPEIQINTTGQILLTQMLLPTLISTGEFLIVNTGSGLGFSPRKDALVYSASKAAMHNFTKGLRCVLKEKGGQVIEFLPPVTRTAMTEHRSLVMMEPDELIEKIIPQIESGKKLVTTFKIRLFLKINLFFPGLALHIMNKESQELKN